MFGSIYIGLSGLSAYSEGLKAVSNNVSNLNTTGFKASDISFSDLYGPGSIGGLELGASVSQGGHGVQLNEARLNFTQGELRDTGRDLDLAIDGGGFFVLLDGDQSLYTRTGSFVVDEEGYIVKAGTDYRLATLDAAGRPVSLNIDNARTSPPVATTRIEFGDNLSSTATTLTLADQRIYGTDGEEHLWTLTFSRADTSVAEWTLEVTDEEDNVVGSQVLRFIGSIVDPATQSLTFADAGAGLSVEFDFSRVTSFSSGTVSSLRAAEIDGHGTGSIVTLLVNEEGKLEATYSNEEKVSLGAIALADFRDPRQLEQRSGGLFVQNGYAQMQYLPAADERVGTILSGKLESSNVDLGAQFGDLILIQRGYQASSQIISVSNDMIQQLFGIRGQG